MAQRPKSSSTERWRERGNKHYQVAYQSESATEQFQNYKKSIHFFEKSFTEAKTDELKASAAKNQAMAHLQLARLVDDEYDDEILDESDSTIMYYTKALELFSKACVSGQNSKTASWSTQLSTEMTSCLESALEHVDEWDSDQDIVAINGIVDVLIDGKCKTECYTKIARLLYDKGLRALAKNDYQEALDVFKESSRPIEQAKQIDQRVDVTELQRNLKRKTRIAEAKQVIQIGIDLKEKATGMQEPDQELRFDTIYGAIDAFREAITITKEKELEIEAMSLSYLGQIYDGLLQQPSKAKDYFMRCVQLTEAMSNQSFVLQAWYSTCTQRLEAYQRSTVNKEEQSRRDIIKNELEKEIKILNEGRTRDIPGRVVYVFKKFPPTKQTFDMPKEEKLQNMSTKELKSLIKKLVIHYHGDKQKIKEKKLKILNEEITKFLNDCLETLKCPDD